MRFRYYPVYYIIWIYFEIAVCLVQDCMTFSLPISPENFDLWIANVPMVVQGICEEIGLQSM